MRQMFRDANPKPHKWLPRPLLKQLLHGRLQLRGAGLEPGQLASHAVQLGQPRHSCPGRLHQQGLGMESLLHRRLGRARL